MSVLLQLMSNMEIQDECFQLKDFARLVVAVGETRPGYVGPGLYQVNINI